MKQRPYSALLFVGMLLLGIIAGAIALGPKQHAEAENSPTRMVEAIGITATTFEDLDNGMTRAKGAIRLGEAIVVEGKEAYIDFSATTLTGQGTLILLGSNAESAAIPLFTGSFHASRDDAARGIVVPGDDVTYELDTIAGFVASDAMALSAINTLDATVAGAATLALPIAENDQQLAAQLQQAAVQSIPCGYSDETALMQSLSQADSSAHTSFTLAMGEAGATYDGTLESFTMPDGGLWLDVEAATLSNTGIQIDDAHLSSPLLFGERSVAVQDVTVTPQGVSLAANTVTMPDICFDGDCATTPIKMTDITAERTVVGQTISYQANGTLNITLPGNQQSMAVDFTTNDSQGSGIAGTIDQIVLTIANSPMTMYDVSLSFAGLVGTDTLMQMHEKLGGGLVDIGEVGISKNGLAFCAGSIIAPAIDFGSATSKIKIPHPTLTLNTETALQALPPTQPQADGYSLGISGELDVQVPSTNKSFDIVGSISTDGVWDVTVPDLALNVAGGLLIFNEATVDPKSGITGATYTLKLANSIGGKSVNIGYKDGYTTANYKLDKYGLKTQTPPKPFAIPNISANHGTVTIDIPQALIKKQRDAYVLDIEGEITISVPGNDTKIKSKAQVDANGKLKLNIDVPITFNIAGSEMTLVNVINDEDGLFASKATLKLPKSLGGMAIIVTDVAINENGLSIGSGSIILPDIKFGDGSKVKIVAPTATIKTTRTGAYEMSLAGTLKVTLSEKNHHEIKIVASIDTDGNLKASVPSMVLNINGATLTMENLTLSNVGLTVAKAELKLPPSLGSVSGEIYNVAIGRKGLVIGGGGVKIPFKDFQVGNFQVTNPTLELEYKSNDFIFGLSGNVKVEMPGSSASVEGTILLTGDGRVSGKLKSFSLTLAGMNLGIVDANIDGGTFYAAAASLTLPPAFGGASVTLYGITISGNGLSLQGGELRLPEINAGGFRIQASGELRKEGDGYIISASGLIQIDALATGPGCSGIGASLTIYTDSFGQMVVDMAPPEDPWSPLDPAIRSATYTPDALGYSPQDPSLQGFQLREVSVTAYCRIPIPYTGFSITQIRGKLTLNSGSVRIEAGMKIQSDARIGPIVVAETDATTYLQTDPFEIGLTGAAYIFTIQIADAHVALGTQGFEAELNVRMFIVKGRLRVDAWSDYRGFNFGASASLEVGLEKGELIRLCALDILRGLPFATSSYMPSCDEPTGYTTLKGVYSIDGMTGEDVELVFFGSVVRAVTQAATNVVNTVANVATSAWNAVKTFAGNPCFVIPPFDLKLTTAVEMGKFQKGAYDSAWGFKFKREFKLPIKTITLGVYVDHQGTLNVTNIDKYKLVQRSQVMLARQAYLAAQNGDPVTFSPQLLDNSITILSAEDTRVTVPVTKTQDMMFGQSRNGEKPDLFVESPSGQVITPDNLPENTNYSREVSYELYRRAEMSQYRVINMLGSDEMINVVMDGAETLVQIASGDVTVYTTLQAGTHSFGIVGDSSGSILVEPQAVVIEEAAQYTMLVYSNDNGIQMSFLADDTTPMEEGAKVRVIYLSNSDSSLDVQVVGEVKTTIAANIETGQVSSYSTIPAGQYQVHMIDPDTFEEEILETTDLEVYDGDVVTLFVVSASQSVEDNFVYVPLIMASSVNAVATSGTSSRETTAHPAQETVANIFVSPLVDYSHPTYIRMVNGIPDQESLELAIYDLPITGNITPTADTGYIQLPPGLTGTMRFQVRPTGSTSDTNLLEISLDAQRQKYKTLVALPGGQYLLLDDDRTIPELGQTHVRVIAGDPDAGAVDIVAIQNGQETMTTTTIASNVGYMQQVDLTAIPGGIYDVEVRASGTSTVLARQAAVNLREGNGYTLYALDSGAGTSLKVTLDLETSIEVQETYLVEQAEVGDWNLLLSGVPKDEENYVLTVQGFNPPPSLTDVHAERVAGSDTEVDVHFTATSDDPATITIAASPGPVEQTDTITNSDGVPETYTIPIYKGDIVAEDVPSTLDGTPQTVRVSLENLESATYSIWVEINDGKDKEVRSYARVLGIPMGIATLSAIGETDLDGEGQSLLAQEDLFTTTIDHTTDWSETWNASFVVTETYQALALSWAPYPISDVDGYRLSLSGPGIDGTRVFELGKQLEWWRNGLVPNAEYTIQLEAFEETKNLTATAETVVATPQDAPFTLTGPAMLGPIARSAIQSSVTLQSELDDYPTLILVLPTDVPDGLAVAITNPAPTACGPDNVLDSESFCPSPDGVQASMTISPTSPMESGVYSITLLAVGNNISRTLTLPITVDGVDFAVQPSVATLAVPVAPAGITLPDTLLPTMDITLDGFNNADGPVTISINDMPEGVSATFWKEGTQQLTPTLMAEETLRVKLDSAIPAPMSAEELLRSLGSITVVGQSNTYLAESTPIALTAYIPTPTLQWSDVTSATGSINAKAGQPFQTSVAVVIPEQWYGEAVTLTADMNDLPNGTSMTFQRDGASTTFADSITLSEVGTHQVNVMGTIPADAEAGRYALTLQVIESQDGTTISTLASDVGVDMERFVDLHIAEGSAPEQTVFRSQTAEFVLDVTIPDGWSDTVRVAINTASSSAALTDLALAEVGTAPALQATSVELSTPGTHQIQVQGTTPSDDTSETSFIQVDLTSGATAQTINLTVHIGADFDTDADNTLPMQQVAAGGTATYDVNVVVPTLWISPVVVLSSEDYQHPDIESMRIRLAGSTDAPVKELVLSEAGSYALEVIVTTSADATPRDHDLWIAYRDNETGALWSLTEFGLRVE